MAVPVLVPAICTSAYAASSAHAATIVTATIWGRRARSRNPTIGGIVPSGGPSSGVELGPAFWVLGPNALAPGPLGQENRGRAGRQLGHRRAVEGHRAPVQDPAAGQHHAVAVGGRGDRDACGARIDDDGAVVYEIAAIIAFREFAEIR